MLFPCLRPVSILPLLVGSSSVATPVLQFSEPEALAGPIGLVQAGDVADLDSRDGPDVILSSTRDQRLVVLVHEYPALGPFRAVDGLGSTPWGILRA